MNNTDFEIRKAIAGDGNTIFECDSNLGKSPRLLNHPTLLKMKGWNNN